MPYLLCYYTAAVHEKLSSRIKWKCYDTELLNLGNDCEHTDTWTRMFILFLSVKIAIHRHLAFKNKMVILSATLKLSGSVEYLMP